MAKLTELVLYLKQNRFSSNNMTHEFKMPIATDQFGFDIKTQK
jgi:hypothetical protein